ncbi:hypothetical protein GOV05_04690 [Candidatus Woesearchaeota archaeon]|nr:hypothetical protein [Candidatus Woesearchaeota archaeon]
MKRKHFFLFFLLILLITSTTSVFGLGVAQDYLENNTLKLMVGQEHTLKIYLQNPEEENIQVKLDVSEDFVNVLDKKEFYNLSPKTYDTTVLLRVTSPNKARIGDSYTVTYSLTPIVEDEGTGMIGMNIKLTRSFDVLIVNEFGVGEKPLKDKIYTLVILITLSLVIALIFNKSALLSKKFFKKK